LALLAVILDQQVIWVIVRIAGAFRRLIMMSGRSGAAREAVPARNKAMDIALNSRSKMQELREVLAENQGLKTIIFTQHNKLV
jgi:superfamily II DNA or RNA helicase